MSDMPVFNRPFESNSASDPNKTSPPSKSSKTVRLNIDLNQINRDGSIVLNYTQLLNEEKARRARGDHSGKSESKSESKKVKVSDNKYQSYAELGAGYDDDDSFIDNTDAYEECLPENMDTKYGGYYINSGELELKKTFTKRPDASSSSGSSNPGSSSSSEDSRLAKKESFKRDHDSSDSKRPHSDGERRKKKAKVIHVPMRDTKVNSSDPCYYNTIN